MKAQKQIPNPCAAGSIPARGTNNIGLFDSERNSTWTFLYNNRKGEKMEIDKLLENLAKEANAALTAMAKTKDVNEKESYSRIVKNLCESLEIFLNLQNEMMRFDDDDDD